MKRVKTTLLVNLRICLIEFYANRLRSFITSLGIFLGVASLLVNLAFVRGMDDDLKDNMERIGGLNIISVHSVDPVTDQEKIAFQQSPRLSFAEAEAVIQEIPQVEAVIKGRQIGWNRVTAMGKKTHGKLVAVSREYLEAFNYSVSAGRTFTDEELAKRHYVCIIGPRIANRLFGAGADPLGQVIRIRNIPVRTIGTIRAESPRNSRSWELLFPHSIFAARFENAVSNLGSVIFRVNDSLEVNTVARLLEKKYRQLHRGVNDFEIETSSDKIKELKIAARGMKVLLWTIAVISLVVGGVSIMNIMFATIGDRIREIGIRKTIGAQRFDIFTQFMIEAVTLCFVGALPGMIVGASVTLMPVGIFPFIPRLELRDYVLSIMFTIMAGLISGLFPALKAAKMQPVEALRY